MLALFIASIVELSIGVILLFVSVAKESWAALGIGILLIIIGVVPLIVLLQIDNAPNTDEAPYKIVTEAETYYVNNHTITENNQLIFSHSWTRKSLRFLNYHESHKHIILSGTWKLIVRETNEVTLPSSIQL